MQDFHRSRGVLRLFARLIRDVWEAGVNHGLVTAGEVDWSSPRIQADLLQRLDRDNFKAAVSADIVKHAGELDGGKPRGIHRRVASALLLESLPLEPSSGLDPTEITLAVVRPDEAGPEIAEALDRLVSVCWHTYPMPGGRGVQFRYEPNVIKQIQERTADIGLEDAKEAVRAEAQAYFRGLTLKLAPWPEDANTVGDKPDLQLALCESEAVAKEVCAYGDYDASGAPLPRRFINAIVAIAPTAAALNQAVGRAQRLLAAEAIEREHKEGESGKLLREQLKRVKPDLQKAFRIQTYRAFDRVVLHGGGSYPLEEKYQVSEEQILQSPQGQTCLKSFLEAKELMYPAATALDVERFLKDILPGATPVTEVPEAYTAKSVHERFLGAPGLRLIPDAGIVRQTLLRALSAGKVVIRTGDGRAYDADGCVQGPEGRRHRGTTQLTSFALDESVMIAPSTASCAQEWLREDAGKREELKPQLPTLPTGVARAMTWEDAASFAASRPLRRLSMKATTPVGAGSLIALAQPLSAERLSLSLVVGGETKDGGTINFAVTDVKPTHPAKPLQLGQTIYNALRQGAEYEATMALDFGEDGRVGLGEQLERLAEDAPDDVSPDAEFGGPAGGNQ
jgi:hypothetical protein